MLGGECIRHAPEWVGLSASSARRTRVVVVQERDGPRRPPPHDARGLALRIAEPPVLPLFQRILQYRLHGRRTAGTDIRQSRGRPDLNAEPTS